jgi:AcrR family transcriptional regulator
MNDRSEATVSASGEVGWSAARADAARNRNRLLQSAAEVFARDGVNASLRDVARRAGVGIATLYRRFDSREAVLAALLGDSFASLTALGAELEAHDDATGALVAWLRALTVEMRAFPGVPDAVIRAMVDGDSGLHDLCQSLVRTGGSLLSRAQAGGDIRSDLTIAEVLRLSAAIAMLEEKDLEPATPESPAASRMLDLAFDGLRSRST